VPVLLCFSAAKDRGNSSQVQCGVERGLEQQCNIVVAECCSSRTVTLCHSIVQSSKATYTLNQNVSHLGHYFKTTQKNEKAESRLIR